MGFFSSVFSSHPADGEDEELEEEETKPENPKFPELVKWMPLEVRILNGQKLLGGRLTAISPTELTIERKPGQLSFDTCPVGTEVTVRGLNEYAITFELKGVIEESTRVKCRVRDLEMLARHEGRANFRVLMNCPATLFYLEDKHFANPESCVLVDISASGACIQSEYIHGEGEALYLKFALEEYAPMTLLGEVIRVEEPTAGKFRYGFLFAQLEEQETRSLTKQLFNIQVGNKREHSRSRLGPGHW